MLEVVPKLESLGDRGLAHIIPVQAYLKQRLYGDAIAELERIAEAEPRLDTAHSLRAVAHAARKEWDAAFESAREAVAQNPENAGGHLVQAMLHWRKGEHGEAAECARTALQLDAAAVGALGILSDHASEEGRHTQALRFLKRLADLMPDSAPVWVKLAKAYAKLGKNKKAEKAFKRAIVESPYVPHTHYAYGEYLLNQERLPEANAAFKDTKRANPVNTIRILARGTKHLMTGDYDAAQETFESIVDDYPKLALGHFLLGEVRWKRNDAKGALESYEEAARLNPSLAAANYKMGVVLEADGKPEDALMRYEEAVRHRPGMAQAHLAMRRMYLEMDDPDRARVAHLSVVSAYTFDEFDTL